MATTRTRRKTTSNPHNTSTSYAEEPRDKTTPVDVDEVVAGAPTCLDCGHLEAQHDGGRCDYVGAGCGCGGYQADTSPNIWVCAQCGHQFSAHLIAPPHRCSRGCLCAGFVQPSGDTCQVCRHDAKLHNGQGRCGCCNNQCMGDADGQAPLFDVGALHRIASDPDTSPEVLQKLRSAADPQVAQAAARTLLAQKRRTRPWNRQDNEPAIPGPPAAESAYIDGQGRLHVVIDKSFLDARGRLHVRGGTPVVEQAN